MRDPVGKILSFGGGGALVLVFGKLGVDAWHDYQTFDDTPRRTGLLGAVDASMGGRQWVAVEGASWRCDRVLRGVNGGVAFLPATAVDGSLVVARFDREIRCDDVASRALTGIIEPMAPSRVTDLRAAGLEVPYGARLRTLDVCSSCGRGNAQLGIVICATLVLLGIGLYPLRRAYQSFSARAHGALRDAIEAPAEHAAEANVTIRRWGIAALLIGMLAIAGGRDYVIYHVLPLHWAGMAVAALGVWMTAFPESYRKLAARRKHR